MQTKANNLQKVQKILPTPTLNNQVVKMQWQNIPYLLFSKCVIPMAMGCFAS